MSEIQKRNRFVETENIDLWAEQIAFWREHMDIFIESAFPPFKLTQQQRIIARQFGRCVEQDYILNRGWGKTWLISLCCFAYCVLYPETEIAICSITAYQATLVLRWLNKFSKRNENIANEIQPYTAKRLVGLTKEKGICELKNGSKIESYSMETLRGQRAKILIFDEGLGIKFSEVSDITLPILNFTRDVCFSNDIPDYTSKTIKISTACFKSSDLYADMLRVSKNMARGDRTSFSMAMNWRSAVRGGITKESFFRKERERLPESEFQMEYESIFLGEERGSWFPYDLTDACRTLKYVETAMPKGSTSKYVVGVDIATSTAETADNGVIVVVKLIEREDGTYIKRVVNMRAFKGKKLDILAEEIRRTYVRFPNTIKIVFDHRGLGDSLPQFLDKPWLDVETGKEYSPWVLDSEPSFIRNALPLLRSFKATANLNQRLANNTRVALEKRLVEFPISSRLLRDAAFMAETDDDDETLDVINISHEEKAIFIEADALQVEMGQVVQQVTRAGTYLYDTTKKNQHKDRYSALAMAIDYISEMEQANIFANRMKASSMAIGVAGKF